MRGIFIVFIVFLGIGAQAQKYTLSGIVYDAVSGETLVGATIQATSDLSKGVATDINGFFSFSGIASGEIELQVSFIGYKAQKRKVVFERNKKAFVEIRLRRESVQLSSITIVEAGADRIGDREIETSQHRLSTKAIKSIPTARNDVFRAIKFMPGIEATEPLSPLVSVRGSDPGENLIMLDGVTIYNPYHFISSSGIFNMQTVKNIDILPGGFGAEYGGRNASVIHIASKDGTHEGIRGEVKPSTVESSVFLEFPLGDKTTAMVAGRFNYDITGNFILAADNYFFDGNVSVTHRFNKKNRLDLKYFGSKDNTAMKMNTMYQYMGNSLEKYTDDPEMSLAFQDMHFTWQNIWNNNIATLIYKSVLSPRFYFRTQVYGSWHSADNFNRFKMNIEDVTMNTSTRFISRLYDITAKSYIDVRPFYNNQLKLGAEYSSYLFSNDSEINDVKEAGASFTPRLMAAFAEDKMKLGPITVRAGIRASKFQEKAFRIEPRVNAIISLPWETKLKLAYGEYNQYIVSMNTQELEFNQFLDYYYPLSDADPSNSTHYIASVEHQINRNQTFSVDAYYKNINRTYTFDLLQSRYEAFAFSNKIVEGTGKTMGIELLWKGQYKRISGWTSYTLAKSTRSFPIFNQGEAFDYDYDHRHTIKGVLNFQATDRISYSTDFMFQSGVPRSVENGLQMFYMYDPLTGAMVYNPQYTIDQKNSSRMPWTMSLNLGLRKKLVSGFGRELARFFGAEESYLEINIRNILFLRRNIMYYIPLYGLDKMVPMGNNYFPAVNMGYTIKF
jgi:hypothetical protein